MALQKIGERGGLPVLVNTALNTPDCQLCDLKKLCVKNGAETSAADISDQVTKVISENRVVVVNNCLANTVKKPEDVGSFDLGL